MKEHSTQKLFWKKWPYKAIIRISATRSGHSGYSFSRRNNVERVEEFARLMYSALRDADAKGVKSVVVIEPIGDGLALAIRDRLMRASKGR